MVYHLHKRNIPVLVHIMNGLPGETKEMMLETVDHLNKLDIHFLFGELKFICYIL